MTHFNSTPADAICLAIRLRKSYYPLRRKLVAPPPVDGDGRYEPIAPASIRPAEKKTSLALEA